jgi:hypothetical protein
MGDFEVKDGKPRRQRGAGAFRCAEVLAGHIQRVFSAAGRCFAGDPARRFPLHRPCGAGGLRSAGSPRI